MCIRDSQHAVEIGASLTDEFTFLNFNTQLISAFDTSGAQINPASNFNLYRIKPGGLPILIPENEVAVINPEGT